MDRAKALKSNDAGLSKSDYGGRPSTLCKGCGHNSIASQIIQVAFELSLKPQEIVKLSGIGCSSRFPYYMNTYGMHSIHGRATAIASGLKATRPELSVWIVTGDGDALSIGGNHLIHLLRRNFDVNILLFNNEIYGLTKGQYSPTSELNKVTKSTPLGSLDHPFNPLSLAMGADATFVARTVDRDPKHLQAMLQRANEHQGSAFLEIYQNCNIFNDGAFFAFTDKKVKHHNIVLLEQGQPLTYGNEQEQGIILDGTTPRAVNLADGYSLDDLWIHDEQDIGKAMLLTRIFEDPRQEMKLPRPFGVFYATERPTYEQLLNKQITAAKEQFGEPDLDRLIAGKRTWTVKG
jgi:2-oxoglutarate ferredoxin oxidoreductase subunit beta